jgi:hypothetical protein
MICGQAEMQSKSVLRIHVYRNDGVSLPFKGTAEVGAKRRFANATFS